MTHNLSSVKPVLSLRLTISHISLVRSLVSLPPLLSLVFSCLSVAVAHSYITLVLFRLFIILEKKEAVGWEEDQSLTTTAKFKLIIYWHLVTLQNQNIENRWCGCKEVMMVFNPLRGLHNCLYQQDEITLQPFLSNHWFIVEFLHQSWFMVESLGLASHTERCYHTTLLGCFQYSMQMHRNTAINNAYTPNL